MHPAVSSYVATIKTHLCEHAIHLGGNASINSNILLIGTGFAK
jgi:hypothetical protein